MPCPNCHSNIIANKPCGPHIGEYCGACGRWLRWVPQGKIEDFIWPIGKTYKGTPIVKLAQTHPDYLLWVIENVSSPSLVKKAIEALTKSGVPIPTKPTKKDTPVPHTSDNELPW